MKKSYLLTPGPTPIPERVISRSIAPLPHHRTAAFETLFAEVRLHLKRLFKTEQEVLVIASTGTGVMEAAVANLFSAGEKVITVNGGKFGERWSKISSGYGLQVIEVRVENGHAVDLVQLDAVVQANRDAKAILFQASETSTGVMMPTREIAALARKYQMLSVCDAITACGVFELQMDAWEIDVLMTAGQKALMIPPGLALIAFSDRAWQAAESSKLPKFYFDLKREKKAHLKNQTAWTPAISLIIGLHEAMKMIEEEGLENAYKRHEILAQATRAGVQALGLEMLAQKSPSTAVTAVKVPSSLLNDGKKIPKIMREKFGVIITGGQDELEGKIFRLSHFGYCGPFDIVTALSALELALADLGYPVEHGKSVGAALQIFSKNQNCFS